MSNASFRLAGETYELRHVGPPRRDPGELTKATQADGYGLGLTLGAPVTLEQAKALHVQTVLRELAGNLSQAALVLAVDRRTLYRMIGRWGFER